MSLVHMPNDRMTGGTILSGSVFGIIIYALVLYYWPTIILEITAFVAVTVLLGILAWIGYTMATTPPPEPIADIPAMKTETAPGAPAEPKQEMKS
jgi:predicted DNA-binding transcriptional regulator